MSGTLCGLQNPLAALGPSGGGCGRISTREGDPTLATATNPVSGCVNKYLAFIINVMPVLLISVGKEQPKKGTEMFKEVKNCMGKIGGTL